MVLSKDFIKIPIAFTVLLVFFLSACNDERLHKNQNEWAAIDTLKITERTHNAKVTYTDSGLLRAILRAPLIEGHNSAERPYVECPKGIETDFYDKQKNIESSLTAGYGIIYKDSKLIEVQKQVVVINVKGEKLETEQLFWDQAAKEIYTDKTVIITTNTEELHGNGMRAAQDFSSWKITNVTGVVTLK